MNYNNKNKTQYITLTFFLIMFVLLTTIIAVGKIGKFWPLQADTVISIGKSFGVTISDNKKVWNIEEEIDVFNNVYVNANGDYYVKNDGKQKFIAPGTKGEYLFTISNVGDIVLDYLINVNAEFKINNKDTNLKLPVVFRIKKANNDYCLGSENEWMSLDELDNFEYNWLLDVSNEDNYILEWKWLETNKNDTSLGILAANNNLSLHVSINTKAESSDLYGGDKPVFNEMSPNNKMIEDPVIIIIIFIITIVLILVIYLWIKKLRKFKK